MLRVPTHSGMPLSAVRQVKSRPDPVERRGPGASASDEKGVTITTLSRTTSVPSSTLRFYESINLLEPKGRTKAGYRVYDPAAVDRVVFIRVSQRAGLSLDDIRSMLTPRSREAACESVQRVLSQRLDDVQQRLAELRRLERGLKRALQDCKHGRAADLCRSLCP